jgi:antitoxin component HigA of HigAB toxin-antitoxin module
MANPLPQEDSIVQTEKEFETEGGVNETSMMMDYCKSIDPCNPSMTLQEIIAQYQTKINSLEEELEYSKNESNVLKKLNNILLDHIRKSKTMYSSLSTLS